MSPQRARPEQLRAVLRQLPTGPGVYLMKGPRRPRPVRRQGRLAPAPGALVLRLEGRPGLAHRADDRRGGRRRLHRHRHGQRGVPARVQPHQGASAALQHPAARRQELPVREDHARRGLPADRAHPQAGPRREPLLRPVRIGLERRRDAEAAAQDLPVPDLQPGHPRGQARPRAALPPLLHQPLPGAVHRGDREGARIGPPSTRSSTSWRGGRRGSRPSCAARCRTTRDALRYEQAAIARDKLRAVERTIEQQKVAAFSRAEHDVIGMAREEGEACLQLLRDPQRQDDRPRALHRRGRARRDRCRGARLVPAAVLRGDRAAAARGARSRSTPADADALAAFLADRRGVAGRRSPSPSAGTSGGWSRSPPRTRSRRCQRERAEWLADAGKRDEALGAARHARSGWRAPRSGSSATT